MDPLKRIIDDQITGIKLQDNYYKILAAAEVGVERWVNNLKIWKTINKSLQG